MENNNRKLTPEELEQVVGGEGAPEGEKKYLKVLCKHCGEPKVHYCGEVFDGVHWDWHCDHCNAYWTGRVDGSGTPIRRERGYTHGGGPIFG